MLFIVFELAAHNGKQVEGQPGFRQRSLVFLRDPTHLRPKSIHGFVKFIKAGILLFEHFFEVGDRLVPYRPQTRGHDEK